MYNGEAKNESYEADLIITEDFSETLKSIAASLRTIANFINKMEGAFSVNESLTETDEDYATAETIDQLGSIGSNIRLIRKLLNLSQKDLADRLHVAQSAVFTYESRKYDSEFRPKTLQKIATALGCDTEDLLAASRTIDVGKRLQIIRRARGLTQQQLGEKMGGISAAAISQFESKKGAEFQAKTIRKFCNALDCEPNDIFGCKADLHNRQKELTDKFGGRIKELRKQRGLSQKNLSEKMNTSQQMISAYEHAEESPKLSTVKKNSSRA